MAGKKETRVPHQDVSYNQILPQALKIWNQIIRIQYTARQTGVNGTAGCIRAENEGETQENSHCCTRTMEIIVRDSKVVINVTTHRI